ncbi:MAG: MFS transporter [Acidimicrobiales bacterium]
MSVDLAERAQMRRAWTTLAAVGFTNLQMAMALSMVFVVFPDLEDSFPRSSSATLSWAVNIFTIVGAATLVIGASLARRWGARQALLAGTALFTLASVAAALSPNVELLVVCRVVQALGSSLIIPSGAAIVYREFPLSKRGLAVTSWAAIGAVGAAAGPSLGGLLIDVGSWRWAFWLNLPFGVVALAVVAIVIAETPADRSVRMPDAASSVLLTVGIGASVLALVQTPDWGWSDARTIASLALGLTLLAVVVQRSLHHARPLLELTLFRDARFGVGNIALLVFSVSFFGFLLTSVLFLTDVWDYSIRRAGLLTTPVFAATALMSVVSGRVAARLGYRTVMAAGGVLWGAGTLWMAIGMTATPSTVRWLGAISTLGLGSGVLWGSMLAVSLSTLPIEAMAAGASLSQTLQNIGNTLGVAIMITALGEITVGDLGAFPGMWVASAVTTMLAVAVCVLVSEPGGKDAGL